MQFNVNASEIHTRIVFAGDSTTEGRIGHSYVSKLPNLGEPWNATEVNLINSGTSGAGVGLYYAFPDWVNSKITDFSPHYIFIMLGLGDHLTYEAEEFRFRYEWLLDEILKVNETGFKSLRNVFLLQFTWAELTDEGYTRANEYWGVIGETAEKYNFGLIDLWNITKGKTQYLMDHAHHSNLGAETIASKIHNDISSEIEVFTQPSVESDTNDSPFPVIFVVSLILVRKVKRNDNVD